MPDVGVVSIPTIETANKTQDHLESQMNIDHLIRYTHTSVDWCVAATNLDVVPASGKTLLISRIGLVTYNPAADFTATIKIQFYDGTEWLDLLTAIGYAPLILTSSRIDTFKIGGSDMVHITAHMRNSMRLRDAESEKLRFTTSDLINGTDKFYCGCAAIEYV